MSHMLQISRQSTIINQCLNMSVFQTNQSMVCDLFQNYNTVVGCNTQFETIVLLVTASECYVFKERKRHDIFERHLCSIHETNIYITILHKYINQE